MSSAIIRWPDATEVDRAFGPWASAVAARHPEVARIGYFGSYARGNWGVGSDLDVVIVVERAEAPFPLRLLDVTDDGLPVPADILVYTEAEMHQMRGRGSRLVADLDGKTVWAPIEGGSTESGTGATAP